jgi:hypothetical protein
VSLTRVYSDEHRPLAASYAGTFAAYALADALQIAHAEAMPS